MTTWIRRLLGAWRYRPITQVDACKAMKVAMGPAVPPQQIPGYERPDGRQRMWNPRIGKWQERADRILRRTA